MNQLHSKSVVVGVDGSHAAVNAAKWAVDEAISRQIPLRLVHVVGRKEAQSQSASAAQPSDWELECGGTAAEPGVIAVVLNDEPDNDEVVHYAMEEGRRRNATVRQIDRRPNSWVRRYPDVPVQVVAAGTGVKFFENHRSAIELAVVGGADANQIAEHATPNCHPIVGYPDCSVLVIRD